MWSFWTDQDPLLFLFWAVFFLSKPGAHPFFFSFSSLYLTEFTLMVALF